MKKYSKLYIAFILSIALVSCKKQDSPTATKNPLDLISQSLFNEEESDFTLLTSSSLGISLLTPNSLDRTSTVVIAYENGKQNIGTIEVNNTPILFDNTHYFLQSDSIMPASNFIGRINNYKFTSENSNQFSSFEEQFYSPNSTLLTFEGIDDGKLPKNNELIVNWNNEDNSPVSLNSIVIISGSNIDGSEPQLIYKIPSPESTSVSFTASELSQLNNFERITVYYAKGYEHIEMINNKSIAFQFINFSNSTIYFKQ